MRGKKSSNEYENVIKIWNIFEMKTIKDYHDFHLKCVLLLLADGLEEFRNNSFKNYGSMDYVKLLLECTNYLSAPPKTELELT